MLQSAPFVPSPPPRTVRVQRSHPGPIPRSRRLRASRRRGSFRCHANRSAPCRPPPGRWVSLRSQRAAVGSTQSADFIARAESSSSGTKYSSHSKRLPTSPIASTMKSWTSLSGSAPADSACSVTDRAVFASPLRIASWRTWRSFMAVSLLGRIIAQQLTASHHGFWKPSCFLTLRQTVTPFRPLPFRKLLRATSLISEMRRALPN